MRNQDLVESRTNPNRENPHQMKWGPTAPKHPPVYQTHHLSAVVGQNNRSEGDMSLVDYASSSGEEDEEEKEEYNDVAGVQSAGVEEDKAGDEAVTNGYGPLPSPSLPPPQLPSQENQNRDRVTTTYTQPATTTSSLPSIELPDAALLLSSPSFSTQRVSGSDHSSRVAAAMSESASRKRDSNGSSSQFLQNKQPKGNFPRPRNVPERSSSLLPPQLLGRSNVVTEDIGRLFVNRRSGPSQ